MNTQKPAPGYTFPCKECGKVYSDEPGMLIHFLQFHRHSIDVEVSLEPFACSVCDLNFLSHKELQKHLQGHKVLYLHCKQCNFKCNYESVLEMHMEVHNAEKTDEVIVDVDVDVNYVEVDDINDTECDPFTCTDCGDTFKRYTHLKWHLITHGNKKYYSCSECEYNTIYQYNFKLHNKQHIGTKQFACSECDYETNNEKLLMKHTNIHKQKEKKLSLRNYRNINEESETSATSSYVNLSYFTSYCTTLTKTNGPKQKKKNITKAPKEKNQKGNKDYARHRKMKNCKILINHENYQKEGEINIVSRKPRSFKRKSALPFKCSYCLADCASLNQVNMHIEIHNMNDNKQTSKN